MLAAMVMLCAGGEGAEFMADHVTTACPCNVTPDKVYPVHRSLSTTARQKDTILNPHNIRKTMWPGATVNHGHSWLECISVSRSGCLTPERMVLVYVCCLTLWCTSGKNGIGL
jgi:hypothetical protein